MKTIRATNRRCIMLLLKTANAARENAGPDCASSGRLMRIAGCCLLFLVTVPTMPAQDVHIRPRQVKRPVYPVNEALRTGTKPMRVDVPVVLIPVTVTDPMNRLVTGLTKDDFRLFEDKERQKLRYFSSEDAPVSIGVVFDVSSSMKAKIDNAREAIMEFLRTANPQDEFFLISFSDRPQFPSGFTTDIRQIQGRLLYTVPEGETALLDAVYLALNQMRTAHHRKRAILVISDGGDNHSRYTEGEVRSR